MGDDCLSNGSLPAITPIVLKQLFYEMTFAKGLR